MTAISSKKKARAWSFIYYPERVEDVTFFDVIADTHVPTIISPLHERDTWTSIDEEKDPTHKAGELKKAHYHGMLLFPGPARITQALEVLSVHGSHVPSHIEPVSDVTALTRYFAHMDNPEKYQYSPEDIQAFCGATISLQKALTAEQSNKIIEDSLNLSKELKIHEYAALVDFCMEHKKDWLPVIFSRAIFYRGYFASLRAIFEKTKTL